MPKYLNAEALDKGLVHIQSNANEMWLVKGYAAADSYATVSGKKICVVPMTSAAYSIAGADGAARVLTVVTKTQAASGSSTISDDLHVVLVDTVNSKVLLATDEITNQVITSGNNVVFPQFTYTSNQPSA